MFLRRFVRLRGGKESTLRPHMHVQNLIYCPEHCYRLLVGGYLSEWGRVVVDVLFRAPAQLLVRGMG